MAHLEYIEDEHNDVIDYVVYCSDYCNRENNRNYNGWNGCHEISISEPCACCGAVVQGIELTPSC